MQIHVAAIGKMRGRPEAALTDDYIKRAGDLGRIRGFSGPDLSEYEAPRGLSGAARTAREGEWLCAAAGDGAAIVLDERGRNLSSAKFASILGDLRDGGARRTAFLIGGADGHDAKVTAIAQHSIAFGAATWPHMLVRAMLAEQIYRAMTILAGHPYHRS